MKVGHTVFFDSPEKPRNATLYRDTTAQTEGAVLLVVAVIGGLGNLLVLGAMAACSHFKTTTTAFLSHHCILDAMKSMFCVPFAAALLLDVDIPHCNALGAAYIFLMTLTAYNLLAIHINEEYQLTDHQGYIPRKRGSKQSHALTKKDSFWCVSFGIVMIWFTTILLHLGVAFLPSSAEFSYDIGNCVFNYGTPKNYVIHVLWAILVTAALLIAIICFASFFCKLRARMHSRNGNSLHDDIPQGTNPTLHSSRRATAYRKTPSTHTPVNKETDDTEELYYEFDGETAQENMSQMRLRLRRVVVMLLMVISFLLFWYPLFILTIMDVSYTRPPQTYRICMILAWTHPITTPVFCAILYFDVVHLHSVNKSTYSPAMPTTHESTSFSSTLFQQDQDHVQSSTHQRFNTQEQGYGFSSEMFPASDYGSPDPIQQVDPEDFYECPRTFDNAWFGAECQSVSSSLPHRASSEEQEQDMLDTHQTLIM